MSVPALESGDIVADKFRIEGPLGRGGMGAVFKATHLALDEPVALKFMLEPATHRDERAARFLREAKAAIRLKSENVARVFDVGLLDEGTPYMVLEYLRGQDLGAVLRTQGRISVETASNYVLQACSGIAEAHHAGIVHRDLKPSNLFVTDHLGTSKLIKVLDFGVSKLEDDASLSTATDQMMGSPLYMSPEQMRSARYVDVRTDIWALGAILYQSIAGKPPFRAGPLPELIIRVMQEPPEPMDDEILVPPGLKKLIGECLAKDEGDRPATIAEFAQELAPFCGPGAELLLARIDALQLDAETSAAKAPGVGEFVEAGSTVTARARRPHVVEAEPKTGIPASRSIWPAYPIAGLLAVSLALVAFLAWPGQAGRGAPSGASIDAAASKEAAAAGDPSSPRDATSAAGARTDEASSVDAGPAAAPRSPRHRTPRATRRATQPLPADAGRSSPRDRRN